MAETETPLSGAGIPAAMPDVAPATSAIEAPDAALVPDEPGAAQPFRFSAASTISPARQEAIGAWYRPFLRAASGTMTDLLRGDTQVEMDGVEVLTCGQLIAGRGDDNQGLLFRLSGLGGAWLLDLPVPLAHFVVERMMGAAGKLTPDETRELTEIEQIIFQQFSSTLLGHYAHNWQPAAEPKLELVRPARHLRQARALGAQPDDLMMRAALRVTFKDVKSQLWIAMPIPAAEDLLLRLGAGDDATREKSPGQVKDRSSPIGSVPVPVSVRWQGFQITLREVASLSPGDLLVLDGKKCENAVVWLGERARFAGRVQREPHKILVTIANPLE